MTKIRIIEASGLIIEGDGGTTIITASTETTAIKEIGGVEDVALVRSA